MTLVSIIQSTASRFIENTSRTLLTLFLLAPLTYLVINEVIRKNARLPGMSGPVGLPLIGHIWDIRINAAEKYREWSKTFGDVFQIQLGNIPIVVVNSASSAKAIFGHNSQALSSRPEFYTFHKVRSGLNSYLILNIKHTLR